MSRTWRSVALVAASCGWVAHASAQEPGAARRVATDEDGFGATAAVQRPIPGGTDEDPTAVVTTVRPDERPHAFDTLDDLMVEVPGAQAWSTGALGAFRALSLRGTGGEHTVVLLGDLPLGPSDGGAFDLSTIPPSLLERVEIYRGGAPAWLGAGTVGGVLRLVPRSAPRTAAEASATAGSFGLWSGRASATVVDRDGDPAWLAAAGATRSDGDFPYLHDPTPLIPGDEQEVRRRNAGLDEGHGLVHLGTDAAGGRLETFVLGYGRTGGVPGHAIQPTVHVRRSLARITAQAGWRAGSEGTTGPQAPWRARVGGGATYEKDALSDRYGEIGPGGGSVTDDRSLALGLRGSGELRVTPWLGLGAMLGVTRDRRAPSDSLAHTQVPTSHRTAGQGAVEVVARDGRWELRASGRLEVVRSELADVTPGRAGEETRATVAAPTARLAGTAEVLPGLAVTAQLASGTRLPSMLELFGDRAFLVGDTRLGPERSLSVEAGAVGRARAGALAIRGEARGFALWVDDLVAYQRNAQHQAVPENVGRARILGLELGARGAWGRGLALVGSATLLDPRDLVRDRTLPLRPRLQAYARPELSVGPAGVLSRVTLFGDVTFVGASFADRANLVATDARLVLGAGVEAGLIEERLVLSATVRDLTDERPSDILGFPLPGRSFAVTLTGRTEGPP